MPSNKPLPRTSFKCDHEDCRNMILRSQREIRNSTHLFCSVECAKPTISAKMKKYTEQDILWAVANAGKTSRQDMALHYGIGYEALKSILCKWRKEGYAIEKYVKTRVRPSRAKASKPFIEMGVKGKVLETKEPAKVRIRTAHEKPGGPSNLDQAPLNAGFAPERLPKFPDRVIVPGKIKIVFKKLNTEMTARDEAHFERILDNFIPQLGESYSVQGLAYDYVPKLRSALVVGLSNSD